MSGGVRCSRKDEAGKIERKAIKVAEERQGGTWRRE